METYMTAKEVAAMVRLSEQTIRRYVMNGEIPFHKVFRAVRFRPSEIEAWFENKNRTSSAEGRGKGEGGLFEKSPAAGTPEAGMAQEQLILTGSQLAALERAGEEKDAHGEIETYHPGYLGAQDTYYVGNIKGVGHIYQQTFIDTYSKVAFCKAYDRKNALVATDMLNDKVIPFFDSQEIPLLRILTDSGSE